MCAEFMTESQDVELVNTKYVKYLGLWIRSNKLMTGDEELEYRIDCVSYSFSQHRQLLQNPNINLKN